MHVAAPLPYVPLLMSALWPLVLQQETCCSRQRGTAVFKLRPSASACPPGGAEGPLSSPVEVRVGGGAVSSWCRRVSSVWSRGQRERAAGMRAERVEINGQLLKWEASEWNRTGGETHFWHAERHMCSRHRHGIILNHSNRQSLIHICNKHFAPVDELEWIAVPLCYIIQRSLDVFFCFQLSQIKLYSFCKKLRILYEKQVNKPKVSAC